MTAVRRAAAVRFFPFAAAAVLAAAGAFAADQPTLGEADGAPPVEVPDEIYPALGEQGVSVTLAEGTKLEFWFVDDQPGGEGGVPGATFPELEVGTLVGVVVLHDAWRDYKGNRIEPGVFTMRYGTRPEDGNHMGVSVHLDFVLLVPVEEDATLEVDWAQADLNLMSFAATGIGHPAVMSLAPNWEGVTETVLFEDDAEGWALAHTWDDLTLGFVVEGEGEH